MIYVGLGFYYYYHYFVLPQTNLLTFITVSVPLLYNWVQRNRAI